MIRHAIPYAAPSNACQCPVQTCGGILPGQDCPDHGNRRNPAMEWHEADGPRCRALQPAAAQRYRCAAGHFLPAGFRLPAGGPDSWDDSCETNCHRGA